MIIDGNGGRERTPLSEGQRGGIRRAVIRSPDVVIAHPRDLTSASATDATALLFFQPALSLVHPSLYLLALILVLLSSSLTSRNGYCRSPRPSSHLRRLHISPPTPFTSLVVDCNIFCH